MVEASAGAEAKAQRSLLELEFTVLDWFGVVVALLGSLWWLQRSQRSSAAWRS